MGSLRMPNSVPAFRLLPIWRSQAMAMMSVMTAVMMPVAMSVAIVVISDDWSGWGVEQATMRRLEFFCPLPKTNVQSSLFVPTDK